MMMTQQASLQPSPVPARDSAIGQIDFGYHWIWTYGHLIPLATFSLATIASVLLNGPLWLHRWPSGRRRSRNTLVTERGKRLCQRI